MGLNITIVRMPGWIEDERFDLVRHVGDAAFVSTDGIKWETHPEDVSCRRPTDFEMARRWVRENVHPEANAKRLLGGLDIMENDAGLWLEVGW